MFKLVIESDKLTEPVVKWIVDGLRFRNIKHRLKLVKIVNNGLSAYVTVINQIERNIQ